MTKSKNMIISVLDTPIPLEHGDFQRIANLTNKGNGKPFTADYVRKVLCGVRHNEMIMEKAKEYFEKKRAFMESLGASMELETRRAS